MLQIKDLTIKHLKDFRAILQDFSFTPQPGDKAAVIGEEGDGKSTLLKLIYDETLVEGYAEWTGTVAKGGLRLGYLAQELTEAQKAMTVYEFFSGIPAFLDTTPKELADAAQQAGLPAEEFYSGQRVGTLSGGEKVKLQLAALLLETPDVLLLDEPSNDIDIEALEWLERFINGAEVPVLFVSHDETLLERTANVIVHIEQVKRKTQPRAAVERMGYREYVEKRLHLFERQEQVAKKERSEYEKQQERFRQIRDKVEHRQGTVTRQDPHAGQLLKKKMKAVKSMERRFDKEFEEMTRRPEAEEAIMLKFAKDVRVENGKKVLEMDLPELRVGETKQAGVGGGPCGESGEERVLARDIRLDVTGPQKVCITGKNGAGKTVLMKEIAKRLLARDDIKAAYMPQNYADLLDMAAAPVEFLAPSGEKGEVTRARTFLGCVKFTAGEMERKIGELSGGQKAKLIFLKMILDGANVLVLDEPTRNFSPLSGPVIRDILRAFGGAVISVSHDRKYIGEVCDAVYELREDGLVKIDHE